MKKYTALTVLGRRYLFERYSSDTIPEENYNLKTGHLAQTK